ncbi:MAG: tol-pal system-associated acyl-CoA thioesterase [Rhodocyclaceae bacterium]
MRTGGTSGRGNAAAGGPVNAAAGATFVFPVRVYFEDTDAAGIVYYASYLKFLERSRTEWLRALGFGQERLRQQCGIGFAVRSLSIDYLKPARLDDELLVISRLHEAGRARLVFDQRIECAGAPIARAGVRVACVDLRSMKPAALPEALRRTFGRLT